MVQVITQLTDAVKLLTLARRRVWIPGGHVIVNVDGLPTIYLEDFLVVHSILAINNKNG